MYPFEAHHPDEPAGCHAARRSCRMSAALDRMVLVFPFNIPRDFAGEGEMAPARRFSQISWCG